MSSTFMMVAAFALCLLFPLFCFVFFPSLLCFVVHIPSKPIVENLMHVKVIE
jgi:hypothetical protein